MHVPMYAGPTDRREATCRCTPTLVWYERDQSKSCATAKRPPPVTNVPRYGNGTPPGYAVYGFLSDAPSGVPSAAVLVLVLVNVSRVAQGWKFVIVFHSLPEMLP